MTAASPKRFKIKPLWVVGLLILSVVGLFFYQLLGPDPTIVVSKATTYITSPLDEDGLPDYEAYLLQQGFEGVTAENNAAVPFWQAMWPGDLDPADWLPLCDALGMPDVPKEKESLVSPYNRSVRQRIAQWLIVSYPIPDEVEKEVWLDRLRDRTAESIVDKAMSGPWTSEQIPPLAQWVEENQRPFDLLLEAAARPNYFSPSPSFLNGTKDDLLSMPLTDMGGMRSAVRAFKARAMYYLGEGRLEEAWEDLRACHRLARHCSNDPMLVDQLVAMAMHGLTYDATQIFLHHGLLSEDLARRVLEELRALPKVSDVGRSIDQGERMCFLDMCIYIATHREDMSSLLGLGGGGSTAFDPMVLLSNSRLDWNLILRISNKWYDRIAAAARLPTRAERKQAFDSIDEDLFQLNSQAKSPSAWISGIVSERRRSELMKSILLGFILPAVEAGMYAEDRELTTLEMTCVAAALAVYRAQHGEYPEQLAELVPGILPKMPLDLYSGNPFIYERKPDGGYLLYSVFIKGIDDGGTDSSDKIIQGEWVEESLDIEYGESDLVIRVPVPEFKMPSPPQAAEEERW